MFSTNHELCRLEHVYAEANLKLKSTCSLKLSSVNGHISSFAKSDKLLETFAAAGVWVARGNGLRLSIHLLGHDTCISHRDGPAFAESLGMVIRDVEVAMPSHESPASMLTGFLHLDLEYTQSQSGIDLLA